jgi:hypothetical protein
VSLLLPHPVMGDTHTHSVIGHKSNNDWRC